MSRGRWFAPRRPDPRGVEFHKSRARILSDSCRWSIPLRAKSIFLSATSKAKSFMASSAQDARSEQDAQVRLALLPFPEPGVKVARNDVGGSARVFREAQDLSRF